MLDILDDRFLNHLEQVWGSTNKTKRIKNEGGGIFI